MTDDKTGVFRFFDGSSTRGVDAFRTTLRIKAMVEPLAGKLDDLDVESAFKVIDEMRKLLKIDEYEESDGSTKGLTDTQVLRLLGEFMLYMDDAKKWEPQSVT